MKNIVILPIVIPEDAKLNKFGGWEWMDYSKKAWQYWCQKHGYKLIIYNETSIKDTTKFRVTVQRWFDIFDFLEKNNIQFDQALMTDACSLPKWDCPDFFKLTNNKLTVRRELDNLGWVYDGVEGYKEIFNGYKLDINKYFNSGFVIFNKTHKQLFKKFKEKYLSQSEEFINLQKTINKGTCQTPLNYIVQTNNVEVNFISIPYNLSHLYRKDLLTYNTQLNEDTTPYFIKYGYVWVFSGFDKTQRNKLMNKVWELVKDKYQ
tara:strand:- start:988 stop:1773 length:786 start_codon:yes stop_codon:yes gene_type:complete